MFSALSRVIPAPTYLTLPCAGVDISDTSLKYMHFGQSTKASGQAVDGWGDIAIPAGALGSGEILKPDELASVLVEFKEQTGAEHVRLSLPEERAYIFETEVRANTPLKEIKSLLEFKLEENVPIPPQDVLFDYSIINEPHRSNTIKVAVVAYSRETVRSYYDVCLAAGLRPLSFEVEAQAMARAVVPRHTTGATMLVDFGKTRTGIGIVYLGQLLYASTVDIGGAELSSVLRKVLGDSTAETELTTIKNTQGLNRRLESSDVSDALLSIVSIVKDELVARMQYWHIRTQDVEQRRINNVVLCGGSSNLKGLPNYLSETLGVPCVRGNVWQNVLSLNDQVPPIDRLHSLGYATAIGLALKKSV